MRRNVGQVLFNPSAENILASASGDYTIKIWDVATGQSPLTLAHGDIVQSLTWNAAGNMLATTSRDKKIRVWDVRQEKPVHEAPGHPGAKNSRAVWMGEHNRFATTGFSKMSERQIALWEPGNTEPIGGFSMIDSISGVCMPFWGEQRSNATQDSTSLTVQQTMVPTACTLLAKGKLHAPMLAADQFSLTFPVTATFVTTNTRTTSLSSSANTSLPILNAALPSFLAVAST